jgi:hypothetical protein
MKRSLERVRATMTARTKRSVRENVGGGRGEIDREVMADYQELFGKRPKILTSRPPSPRVKETRSSRGAQVKKIGEYSREVTVSVTTACSYSDFPCSYSFQLPRASLPPHTAGEGAAGRRCGPRATHSSPGGGANHVPHGPKAYLLSLRTSLRDHPGFAVGPIPSCCWDARCGSCHWVS